MPPSRMWIAAVTLTVVALLLDASVSRSAEDGAKAIPALPIGVSRDLYRISMPPDHVPTAPEIALGEKLFTDKRLSSDGTIACDTCHDRDKGFTDHRPGATSAGVGGRRGSRNAPTILNAMFHASQFWDGRSATLEDQAKLPILNPVEMGRKNPDDVVAAVRAVPGYARAFREIYGHDVTFDDLAAAIATFERTLYSGSSPFDRFLGGDAHAIDASAQRGWALFNGKARCNDCHEFNAVNPLFSDQKFHNIGIAAHKQNFVELARKAVAMVQNLTAQQIDQLALQPGYSELGRFLITRHDADIGAFKTETLRNIGVTGPYMHDGSLTTLWDVVDHYNKGGVANPYLDGGIQRLGLTETQIDDLVAFLFTLTDDRFADFNKAETARQTALKNTRPQRETAVALGQQGDLGDIGPNPDLRNPATIGYFGDY
jgi:cytochrome c peroxidase